MFANREALLLVLVVYVYLFVFPTLLVVVGLEVWASALSAADWTVGMDLVAENGKGWRRG